MRWKTTKASSATPPFASARKNLLYASEDAPKLAPWQRGSCASCARSRSTSIRSASQGHERRLATFWHYTILHQLYEEGLVNDAFMMELLQRHTNVIYQPLTTAPY